MELSFQQVKLQPVSTLDSKDEASLPEFVQYLGLCKPSRQTCPMDAFSDADSFIDKNGPTGGAGTWYKPSPRQPYKLSFIRSSGCAKNSPSHTHKSAMYKASRASYLQLPSVSLQQCHLDIFSASVSTLEAKPVPTELQSSSRSSFILQCVYLS